MIYVGIDWGESKNAIAVVDEEGTVLGRTWIEGSIEGLEQFTELVGRFAPDRSQAVVGTETDRGLLIQLLSAAGYVIYPINPLSGNRYRDRHKVSGGKSDPADAVMLAHVVRTDRHNHRPMAVNSELAEELKVLSRRHQDLVWDRSRLSLRLRSILREYYPGALKAFTGGLTKSPCLAVLERAPTPAAGRKLSEPQIIAALKKGGRKHTVAKKAAAIHEALRLPQLELSAGIAQAHGETVAALARILIQTNAEIARLNRALKAYLKQHPDAEVILSFPGIDVVLGARLLAEFGDQPNRYADSKCRQNFSGVAPITQQSGKSQVVKRRLAKKRRLSDACFQWADCAYKVSPGAKLYYHQLRQRRVRHPAAVRALANRMVGLLHACLRDHTLYDEAKAWPQFRTRPEPKAA